MDNFPFILYSKLNIFLIFKKNRNSFYCLNKHFAKNYVDSWLKKLSVFTLSWSSSFTKAHWCLGPFFFKHFPHLYQGNQILNIALIVVYIPNECAEIKSVLYYWHVVILKNVNLLHDQWRNYGGGENDGDGGTCPHLLAKNPQTYTHIYTPTPTFPLGAPHPHALTHGRPRYATVQDNATRSNNIV